MEIIAEISSNDKKRQYLIDVRDTYFDGKEGAMAKRLDMSKATLWRIINGTTKEVRNEVVEATKSLVLQMVAGNQVIGFASEMQALPKGVKLENLAFVPIYTESASAGFGEVHVFWEIDPCDFMAFTREWLIREVRINPDDAFVAEVRGESMKPMLRKGDLVLCEKSASIETDGIYIVCWNSRLMIKHIQLTRDPLIYILRSEDAKNYPEQEVNLHKSQNFFVVGKYCKRVSD